MDLSTTYLGLSLPHPFLPGASPMVDDLGTVRRLEDAGAAAIVMHSLFEEQIRIDQVQTVQSTEWHEGAHAEASSYFPQPHEYRLGPDQYLEQLRRIKNAVSIPVIGSLNGVTPSGWLHHAKLLEEAGADAVELNVYRLVTSPEETAADVERRLLEIVETVRAEVEIPIAVKLSPFFSALPHLVGELERRGANGVVLFNRFYQPDIDIELLEVQPSLHLSDSHELLLRLRWIAILSGQMKGSIAVSGGVHTAADAIKSIMVGAHAVQLVSELLLQGPDRLRALREEVGHWMEEHEYESLGQMQGSMSLERCPDPAAFERANYMKILQGWRHERRA